eukprot:11224806-Lingulodinium_polyedra.AAC.1
MAVVSIHVDDLNVVGVGVESAGEVWETLAAAFSFGGWQSMRDGCSIWACVTGTTTRASPS